MNPFRLPLLVLAAPLLLSACGSGSESGAPEQVQSRQVSANRTLVPTPVVTTFSWQHRDNVNLKKTAIGFSVSDKAPAPFAVSVAPNSRLRFSDISIALDVDGVAGKAYRAYRAAFGRSPDVAGLSYWIAAMDAGMPLERVAGSFIESPEFKALSDAAPPIPTWSIDSTGMSCGAMATRRAPHTGPPCSTKNSSRLRKFWSPLAKAPRAASYRCP